MTDFDVHERQRWAGRAVAYARSFAPLCAHPAAPLLDAAGVTAGDRVLDVGTGTGTVAALAAVRGGQVVAVDAAPSMVDATRRRLSDVHCTSMFWTHRTDPEDWWSGPANGVATAGLVLEHQPQHRIAGIRAVFDRLTAPYREADGRLSLPTSALLASAVM
jgi:trans-aconitate methyltransferase